MIQASKDFYGGYQYKCPSKKRRDRLRRQKFLVQFRRDPELFPVTLLASDYLNSPSALPGTVPVAVMIQATELMIKNVHSVQVKLQVLRQQE